MAEAGNTYQSIAERTDGNIYIGVIGPVRTGKSTFVKRMMETMVIPKIQNIYQKERAMDELPQSGSGKTIMTSEPKFVPEEAVSISPDGVTTLSVRLIDSVGYVIPGALGAEENGAPRMVTTPWLPYEISMEEAANLGTKKIMEEHCTIGILVTTDGSITDLEREAYREAEDRSIRDMMETGKPFIVLINSVNPAGPEAAVLKASLESTYGIRCLAVNCQTLQEDEILSLLKELLYEFPVRELQFYLPGWLNLLAPDHPLKAALFEALRSCAAKSLKMRDAEAAIQKIASLDFIDSFHLQMMDPGNGAIICKMAMPNHLYYDVLTETTGFPIQNEKELMQVLQDLSAVKKDYDKISSALERVRATGYGIVMPTPDEMKLEVPEIVRKGGNFGVKLKASAPSIHMLRADIQTEISPIVGDEKQSEELLQYLLDEYDGDTGKLWESHIFGKSVFELVNEGLSAKIKRMPEDAQFKLQSTLSRVINEGSTGLLCIILA